MPEYRMPPALSSCPRYGDALHPPKPFLMPVPAKDGDQQQQQQVQTILPPVKENLKIRFAEEILVTEIEDRFYYNESHAHDDGDGDDDDDSYEIEIVEDDGDADFYLEIVDGEVFYVFETEDDISVDSSESAASMDENIDVAISVRTGAANNSLLGSSDDDETGHDQSSSYFSGDKSMSSMDQSLGDLNFSLDDMAAPDLDTSVEFETPKSDKQQVQVQQEATPAPAAAAAAAAAAATPDAAEEDLPAVINIIEMEPEDEANQDQQQQPQLQQDEAMPDVTAETPSRFDDNYHNDNVDATGPPRTTDALVSKAPPTKPQRQPSVRGSGLKELRAGVEKMQNFQDSQEQPTLPQLEPLQEIAPAKPQDSVDDDEKPFDEIGGEGASTQNVDIVSPLAPPKMSVTNQAKQDVHACQSPAAAAGVGSPPLMTSPLTPSKLASPGKSILRANPPSPRKKPSGAKREKDKDKKKTKTFTKTYVRPEQFDGEHQVYSWEKPDWAKKDGETKLRSTGKGDDIRKGANLANPITFCIKGPVNPGVEEDDEKAGTKVSLAEITTTTSVATNAPTTTATTTKRAGGMDMEEVMRRLNAGERVAAAGVPYYRKNQRRLRISMNGAKIRDGADIVKPITMATIRTSEDAMLNKVANQKVLKTTTTGQEVRKGKDLAAPVTMPLIKFDDTNHVANKNVLKNKGVAPKTNKQYDWEKPEWAQRCKLKSTDKGDAVKQGMDLQAPITHITQIGRYRSFDSMDSDNSRGISSADCNVTATTNSDDDKNDNDGDPLDRVSVHERRHLLTEIKVHEWEKPTWTKNKPLTPSSKGLALKKGENLANPITFPHRRPESAAKVSQPEEIPGRGNSNKQQQEQPQQEQPQQEQDGKSTS